MRDRPWTFLVATAVTGVLFVDWCGVVFQCGCRSLWSDAASACNIHAASPPHCPWCEHPLLGGAVAFAATILAQWVAVYRLNVLGLKARLGLALLAFPVSSGLVALVQGVVWSYWSR